MNKVSCLPAYSIRESRRARRVTLRVSPEKGLEVVIPTGFDRKRIPRIVEEKKDWIQGAYSKLKSRECSDDSVSTRPELVYLRALDRRFLVQYSSRTMQRMELRQSGDSVLEISGDISNVKGCHELLKAWLRMQADFHLVPWLHKISDKTGLTFRRVSVRSQKSRWGSCSIRGTISLNCKLLFLSPELVNYIMIHELCHTVHPNHSSGFWSFVGKLEPEYRELDARMKDAARDVPRWTGW